MEEQFKLPLSPPLFYRFCALPPPQSGQDQFTGVSSAPLRSRHRAQSTRTLRAKCHRHRLHADTDTQRLREGARSSQNRSPNLFSRREATPPAPLTPGHRTRPCSRAAQASLPQPPGPGLRSQEKREEPAGTNPAPRDPAPTPASSARSPRPQRRRGRGRPHGLGAEVRASPRPEADATAGRRTRRRRRSPRPARACPLPAPPARPSRRLRAARGAGNRAAGPPAWDGSRRAQGSAPCAPRPSSHARSAGTLGRPGPAPARAPAGLGATPTSRPRPPFAPPRDLRRPQLPAFWPADCKPGQCGVENVRPDCVLPKFLVRRIHKHSKQSCYMAVVTGPASVLLTDICMLMT